jgi:hypothetical protein
MTTIDEFVLKNIGLWWRYGISRHCDEYKYIIIGRIFESEINLIPPSLKISESSSNGSYRNTDEVWWRYGISRSCDEWSDFDVLWRKFGYQKQQRLKVFYSVQDIFINLSACLYIYVCVRVAIYYFGFPVFIDRIEGTNKRTNERTDRQLFLILYTHRFARG